MKYWRLPSVLVLLAIAGCDSPDGEIPIVEIQDPKIISSDLIEFHTGTLDAHTMNAIGLSAADQVRLQRIVDELRADLSKFILESRRKRHDKYGNLLVEIPDARVEGRVFRDRLFERIHEDLGGAISIHFKGLFEDKWSRGIVYSLSEDWFHFGDPVIYIVRGGEHDERRGEIPPGELWIQSAGDGDRIEGGYENSIYICRYEDLPRYLRDILSQRETEPFVGPEKTVASPLKLLPGKDGDRLD